MNETGPRPRRHRAALTLAIVAGLAQGCANPLGPSSRDYAPGAPREKLRVVGTLRLEPQPEAAASDQQSTRPALAPPPDIAEGAERVEVSIEQCRAWTLSNNLDLQVALIEPTIAREALFGEEAKFESLFFTDVRYNDIDSPISSIVQSNQAQILDIVPGVQIPLATGGTVTVSLPLNRTEANAAVTTLNPAYESDLSFSISQPLLRGGGRRTNTHSIRIQALETQIAESRGKLEVIRQLAAVDRAYWRLYAAARQLEVAQDQYDLAKAQLDRAERRVRAQVSAEVEVIRAQSGVAERLEFIIVAQNNLRTQSRELKRIINVSGLEIGTFVVLVTSSPPEPVQFRIDPEALARAAVENRMEMLELELRLAQDYSTIDFEKNLALPLFTLDYSYNINGLGSSFDQSFTVLRENMFEDWSVGARLEVPIGNEQAESRVHQAILRRLQRLSSKDARRLAIRQEVFNAADQLVTNWQRILAARQATILAARTLQAEQNQFEVGARTSTDVLDAATALANAQLTEINALTDYQIAQVDLAFATGTLLGASKVDWEPRDPRRPGTSDFVGEPRGRKPLGPPGPTPLDLQTPESAEQPAAPAPAQPTEPVPPAQR